MASTAVDSANAAGPAPPPAIPTQCMYKSRLQQFVHRAHKRLPIYSTKFEGEHHRPKYKCTVVVCGQLFTSTQSFSRRKEAEQDAARVAYETLVTRDKGDVGDRKEPEQDVATMAYETLVTIEKDDVDDRKEAEQDVARVAYETLVTRDEGDVGDRKEPEQDVATMADETLVTIEKDDVDDRKEAEQDVARVAYETLVTRDKGDVDNCKEAEQDVARVAYKTLVTRDEGDMGDLEDIFELIGEDVVFCKAFLLEYAVKMKATWPSYSIVPQQMPMTLFVASVVFDGSTYTGEAAISKKDAEQKAARAAVKSILATGDTCMMGIVRSKEKLITTIKSSRNRKDTRAVSLTPIKFTQPAAYTGYGGQDQSSSSMTVIEHNAVAGVDPCVSLSAKVVNRSRKRKGTGGRLSVDQKRVAKEH